MVFCNSFNVAGLSDRLVVTILILIDGFLQYIKKEHYLVQISVTILILIDGFLQYKKEHRKIYESQVTILILIDGFLQYYQIQ